MPWDNRVVAWRKSPPDAHKVLIDLNIRYGVDDRDPNS
jgi:hypothetical protein